MNKLELRLKANNDGSDRIDLVTEIKIDRELLADFEYYATDLRQFNQSMIGDGEFFILTCWCGFAECAGIKRGVWVTHDRNSVFWKVDSFQQARRFVFNKAEYIQAFKNLIKQGNRLIEYLKSSGDRELSIVPFMNEAFYDKVSNTNATARR